MIGSTQFFPQTYQQTYLSSKRVTDGTVADSYNAFIWALAGKFTSSIEEAAAAVNEMQADIQRCEASDRVVRSHEDRIIARIAWRRLLKFLQTAS